MVDETNEVVEQESEKIEGTEETQESTEQETEQEDSGDSLLGKKGEETVKEQEVVIPEKYEFTMPEGRELDVEMVEKVTPLFKELKISQEGAQKLADLLVSDQEAKEVKYKLTDKKVKNLSGLTFSNCQLASLGLIVRGLTYDDIPEIRDEMYNWAVDKGLITNART